MVQLLFQLYDLLLSEMSTLYTALTRYRKVIFFTITHAFVSILYHIPSLQVDTCNSGQLLNRILVLTVHGLGSQVLQTQIQFKFQNTNKYNSKIPKCKHKYNFFTVFEIQIQQKKFSKYTWKYLCHFFTIIIVVLITICDLL